MKMVLLFLTSAVVLMANPQRFAITRGTLHSGGSMRDAGGRFVLTATAGQPEAVPEFTSADSRYALAPGFWPAAVSIAAPGAPPLRFLPAASGYVQVAWPVEVSGWRLEESADLLTWALVAKPVADTPTDHTVTVAAGSGFSRRFFRLRCP
jgi:hypothetical protein